MAMLGAIACEDGGMDIDYSKFDQLKSLESVDFSQITPRQEDLGFFQLREIFIGEENYIAVNQSGTLCEGAENEQACKTEFDDLVSDTGFGWHGHPADSVYYLATNSKDSHETINTVEGVLDFLGTIDTKEDAILFARANDFFWSADKKENGAIREVEDGYELVVTELVSLCTPLQSDRVLIHISSDGNVTELDREILSREPGVCA